MSENRLLIPSTPLLALALFRFYWNSSVRLVQRVFLPFFASFAMIYAFMGYDFFQNFTAALIGGGYFASAIPSTLFSLFFAVIAGRRVTGGLTGWIRHLPVSTSVSRNTAITAIFVSILPVLGIPFLLTIAAAKEYQIPLIPHLPGLILAGLAAALYVLPMKRALAARVCLVMACLCYTSQNWILFFSGLLLHLLAMVIAGPMVAKKKRTFFSAEKWFDLVVTWRALRFRLLVPYVISGIVFPVLFLLLNNNALDDRQAGMAIRLAAGVSLTLFCAVFTQLLASRRPAWLWRRSLPDSSRNRLFQDGISLLVHLTPLVIVFSIIRCPVVVFILAGLPALIVFSVMGGRRVSTGRIGVFGWIIGQTSMPVLLFTLFPWISLLFLAMVPVLLNRAVFEEKSLRVSQWQEITHVTVGDSQSWREN